MFTLFILIHCQYCHYLLLVDFSRTLLLLFLCIAVGLLCLSVQLVLQTAVRHRVCSRFLEKGPFSWPLSPKFLRLFGFSALTVKCNEAGLRINKGTIVNVYISCLHCMSLYGKECIISSWHMTHHKNNVVFSLLQYSQQTAKCS